MNTDALSHHPDGPELEREQAREEELKRTVEAVKSCLQTALLGESQTFRSWVAAAHRKFDERMRLATAMTALACLFSLLILAASLWEAHRITTRAEIQWQALRQPVAATGADPFLELRRQNWEPVGKLIIQKGRTFTELKAAQ